MSSVSSKSKKHKKSKEGLVAKAALVTTNEFIVREYTDSEASSQHGSSEEDERKVERPRVHIPPEYWHIQKLVKYMKTGNETATVVTLCCLREFDLKRECNQLAISEIGGLEILINLLSTKDLKCKLGALAILKDLSLNKDIRRNIADLGGIEALVKNLAEPAKDLQILVAETIYNVAQTKKARAQVRHCNGIERLVDFLDITDHCIKTPKKNLRREELKNVRKASAAAKALCSVSESKKNVTVLMKSGSVPLFGKLMKSIHMKLLIPTIATLAQCARDKNYQLAIETHGIITDIVKHLSNESRPELRRYCAETIFRCSENAITREIVRKIGGLDPLVLMMKDPNTQADKRLLAAVTGAIWKTAISPENIDRYNQLKTVEFLAKMLENPDEDEEVLCNVVGALFECMKVENNKHIFRRSGGIPHLVNLLNYTFPPMLENVSLLIRECAFDPESMQMIEELDGVRLLWSLLKNEEPQVQANAAFSLVPLIRFHTDSGEMVRCLVGALELVVTLLQSPHIQVVSSTCATISEIAKDTENLAILTDHGVIPMLVNLIPTENINLREHLASAIAFCCDWGTNLKTFGKLGAITPLVRYLTDRNTRVHRTTALALYHLSKDPFNCVTLHETGAVVFLLRDVQSKDPELQEAAAGCLANIRKLALEAETIRLVTRKYGHEDGDDEGEDDDDGATVGEHFY